MKKLIKNIIYGKTILITGGTGSFGKHVLRFMLNYHPRQIIIFSRDEDKQYSLQQEFINKKKELRFVIGDVRDFNSLDKVLREGVDVVLHAAALKQIPSTEYNIMEAVKTNVIGAQNVVDACITNNVDKVVAISTDKAVEPVNVMGLTKALQEKIIILGNKHKGGSKTKLSVVRYGNVVASRGSVIPLYKKQIIDGGPITLTDKRMTRFIITLDEAVWLIMVALKEMAGGEIFVPKIKPLKINDLAQVMIKKLKPKDKRIIEIGIRPGEKLHETLISPIESIRTINNKLYYIVLPQIELASVGYTYKNKNYKNEQFRYSSDNENLLSKRDIELLLEKENII